MQATEPKDSNPYVAVVAKKHRNLKKKLERIAKAEQLLAQGKVLDEEQRILLSSKKAIEKSVAELANIKQMLEEVAKCEESNCKTEKDASAPSTTEAEVPDVSESTAQDAATFTESAEQFAAATMTEEEDQDEQFEEPVPEVDLKEKFNQFIERLIKALHVYERYANVTSQPLPDTVMYFGRTLLGLTSISSFQDTLANSIRVAGFYLHDDLANSNDVIRGTSYAKLATEIDALVEEMERAQQRGSTNALTALLRNTIAPVSPTNAPATVETSTYESTGLYGSLQFGDQSLGAFNQFQYTAPSPVYSAAPEPVGFQAAPAAASAAATETRPVVPIAPTLPEYEHEPVIEEPLEEEEEEVLAHHHHVPETEEHDAHIEEIVDDEEEDMTNAVNPTSATAAGGAEEEEEAHRVAEVTVSPEEEAKARVSKNIRVRGDPSRAARKAEDAKKAASRGISHHHEHMVAGANNATHHHVEAPKTFRDRLLVSSHHHTAAAAPVAAAPAAVVAQETSEEAEKRTKRAPRSSTATTAPVTAANTETAGETASPTSATKRDRNTRTRTRRSEGETAAATTEQATEAGKKWSAIAANPTSSEAEVAAAAAVGGAEEKKAVSSSHRVSAPKPARSSTGGGANATRPRREKPAVSEETAHHVHVANQEHADGFQPVSRRTPSSTGGAAAAGATSASSGAAKKEKDNGEKKTASSAPRGDRPPAKKPTPFK